MEVVLMEPGKVARIANIGNELKDLQEIVGGLIEAGYFFEDPVCLICNEEGKMNGLPLNRGIYNDDGKLMDIIAGTAFICGCGEESFRGLSSEEQDKYLKRFYLPETFFYTESGVKGVKFTPNENLKMRVETYE